MHASSFVVACDRIEKILERALALETFQQSARVYRIADRAIATIDDLGEIATVALPNVTADCFERTRGDDAIRDILTERFNDGMGTSLDDASVASARDSGRIDETNGHVIVPIEKTMPTLRNWWVLADLLYARLEQLREGFQRVHRRAAIDASAKTETAFWMVRERVAALADALSSALVVGRYTRRSAQQGASSLLEGVETIVTAVTGDIDA